MFLFFMRLVADEEPHRVVRVPVWFVLLLGRSKGHKSRKKAKERREEEERVAARERALQDEVRSGNQLITHHVCLCVCVCVFLYHLVFWTSLLSFLSSRAAG